MSTADTVISSLLLGAVGALVAGWLLLQLVGEVLYRVWDRPLSSLRPRRPRITRHRPVRAEP